MVKIPDKELNVCLKKWNNALGYDKYLMSPSSVYLVETTVKLLMELKDIREGKVNGS